MKKIVSIILIVILLGIFVISAISCSGNAYKGEDPKNAAAKKAGGLSAPQGEPPAAVPEGASSGEQPAEAPEGGS
jgi:hypothetical protein